MFHKALIILIKEPSKFIQARERIPSSKCFGSGGVDRSYTTKIRGDTILKSSKLNGYATSFLSEV